VESCMAGTRLDILKSIHDWANELHGPNVFWLHGYPGTGKSAIAMTVTAQLLESGRLASSFFFKREEFLSQTPTALWCSVAYDLADIYPEVRSKMLQTLDSREVVPHITGPDDIFDKLIMRSLGSPLSVPPGRVPVLVIDALDECGGLTASRPYQKQVLSAISRWKHLPSQVKLFVTSRNERNIHSVLGSMGSQCKVLEVGEKATPESYLDIENYLRRGFDTIHSEYKSLPDPWPTPQDLRLLTDAAAGLFIWASTVLKVVGDHQPKRELEQILQVLRDRRQNQDHESQLEQLYQSLLTSKFPSTSDAAVFKQVAGAILAAQIPLTLQDLEALVPSLTSEDLEFVCTRMNSVLDSESGLRFVHQSFVDFLFNLPDGSPFNYEWVIHEQRMVSACFATMTEQLKFNIAGVQSSYWRNDVIPGLGENVANHLYYACQFWSPHLQSIVEKASMLEPISRFIHKQLLFWLEVLSARRVTGIASGALADLNRWLPSPNGELKRDVQDAMKFVRGFGHPIAVSIPHIYVSALRFAPTKSRTVEKYGESELIAVGLKSGGSSNWLATDAVLHGHLDSVNSVAFSSHGTHIVSGSSDNTVHLWDTETQTQIGAPLEGHTDWVLSVAFSPDGTRIVSGSGDRTVRVWDTETQIQIGAPLEGHTGWVQSVAFSPDGTHIVSGSSDNTVRVWDAETQTQIGAPLEGHTDRVRSVAFSPDGTRIASGSGDNTVRLWDAETQTQIGAPLEGHTITVTSVAFSPDGSSIVSGSGDKTVRVWNTETQTQIGAPLGGHTSAVSSVAFSPDGSRIVSGSDDNTVRVWN
ncbi:WD40-repeat-containing domain protein, partial [Mycena vulgaris]